MCSSATVFVVDDDRQARESVCALVSSMGLETEAYASSEAFLTAYRADRPGCLVTDLRMPGMSGLELQQELLRRHIRLPLVILTAYARTPVTVAAMKSGAVTLLEKPYADDDLWDAIREALARDAAWRIEEARQAELRARMAQLSPAERQVMERIIEGKPNKAIAQELGVSVRTIEGRRHEILAKMQADSVAALVCLVIDSNHP